MDGRHRERAGRWLPFPFSRSNLRKRDFPAAAEDEKRDDAEASEGGDVTYVLSNSRVSMLRLRTSMLCFYMPSLLSLGASEVILIINLVNFKFNLFK